MVQNIIGRLQAFNVVGQKFLLDGGIQMKVLTLEQARGKEGKCRCGATRELIRNERVMLLRCVSRNCKEPDEKVTITDLEAIQKFTEPAQV